jgi:hypothetical protein
MGKTMKLIFCTLVALLTASPLYAANLTPITAGQLPGTRPDSGYHLAASKNDYPDSTARTAASHHKHKPPKRAEPRPDPELGIHGFFGAGPVGGFVGSQGQAGYNW